MPLRNFVAGGILLLCLHLLTLVQYIWAEEIGMRTVEQMQARGIARGLPLDYHYGVLGDYYYLSYLVAISAIVYADRWSQDSVMYAVFYAVAITVVLGGMWCLSATPEAHVLNHRPTIVAYPHLVYMVPVITVLILLGFYTDKVNPLFLAVVGVVLVLHLFAGQHMLLGLQKLLSPHLYTWYPDQPLKNPVAWVSLVAVAGLFAWRVSKVV